MALPGRQLRGSIGSLCGYVYLRDVSSLLRTDSGTLLKPLACSECVSQCASFAYAKCHAVCTHHHSFPHLQALFDPHDCTKLVADSDSLRVAVHQQPKPHPDDCSQHLSAHSRANAFAIQGSQCDAHGADSIADYHANEIAVQGADPCANNSDAHFQSKLRHQATVANPHAHPDHYAYEETEREAQHLPAQRAADLCLALDAQPHLLAHNRGREAIHGLHLLRSMCIGSLLPAKHQRAGAVPRWSLRGPQGASQQRVHGTLSVGSLLSTRQCAPHALSRWRFWQHHGPDGRHLQR
mmetsp:Transcript_54399/g.94972  ORF Transcript_54399/g.94972 Transcript_54399/m.94972 type:complete len:295 (+) Transcript_54399:2023-2907(+)